MSVTSPTPARPARRGTAEGPARRGRVRKVKRFSGRDRLVVTLMLGIPAAVVLLLVWIPALFTVVLGFARWEGIGGLDTIQWVGLKNYRDIATIYPPFYPALQHNLIWLVFMFLVPTLLGWIHSDERATTA